MTVSNTPTPTPNSSCSTPMVNADRSDSVLKLGEKIVEELGLNQTVDTLGRWMAHYIAEKIEDVETATEDRAKKMSVCADAILKLWSHRSEFPNGKRPLEDFEPIFRAFQSLDPDDTTPRYFRQARSAVSGEGETSETKRWLDVASELDFTARILIRYCLAVAVKGAVNKSREWLALAEAAIGEDDVDVRIARVVFVDINAMNFEIPTDQEREKTEALLKKLDAFTELANTISSHLRQKLTQPSN